MATLDRLTCRWRTCEKDISAPLNHGASREELLLWCIHVWISCREPVESWSRRCPRLREDQTVKIHQSRDLPAVEAYENRSHPLTPHDGPRRFALQG